MDINNKIIYINKLKSDFNTLLKNIQTDIDIYSDKICELKKKYIDWIQFTDKTRVYEKYNWCYMKDEYYSIKKKINNYTKEYNIITKLYSSLTNYYTYNEIESFNKIIADLNDNIDLIKFNYNKLDTLRREIYYKKNMIIRTKSIIIISSDVDSNIKELITKLHDNYNDLKILYNDLKKLKNIQRKLINEIRLFQSTNFNL